MPGIFSIQNGPQNVNVDELLAEADRSNLAAGRDDANVLILQRLAAMDKPYLFNIKGPDGTPLLKTDLTRDAAAKVASIIEAVPEGKPRRKLIGALRRQMESEKRERHDTEAIIADLRSLEQAMEELQTWLKATDVRLERPTGTLLHKFREALLGHQVGDLHAKSASMGPEELNEWDEATAGATVFIVEHNWSGAFEGATDYASGEIKLPDDLCAFEFMINGLPVIAFGTSADGVIILQHAVRASNGRWILFGASSSLDDSSVLKTTFAQVRAITVALDAEVATTEVVRAPHRLNHAREQRGKLPIYDYHVVSLARRTRAAPLPDGHQAEPGTKKKLHFRRGHWRHFATHKIWIKWMLVGNPDLGFVDKHYRI